VKTIKLDLSHIIDRDTALNKAYNNPLNTKFSICSEIKNSSARTLTRFFGCREAAVGAFSRFLDKETDDSYVSNEMTYDKKLGRDKEHFALYEHKDMPTGKTSVAFHMNTSLERHHKKNEKHLEELVERAVCLLNHYERRNKWALSEVYKTRHDASDSDGIYLFRSSKWWMTSTHTLSLYMLLIRLGEHNFIKNIDKSTPNSKVLSVFNKIDECHTGYSDVHKTYPKMWNILLDNRKKIYKGNTQKDNFSFNKSNTVKIDGIRRLCSDCSCYYEISERFNELCKKAGLEPGD
jgi:hypothetical protein